MNLTKQSLTIEICKEVDIVLQQLEELGGPARAEYVLIMTAIKLRIEERIKACVEASFF